MPRNVVEDLVKAVASRLGMETLGFKGKPVAPEVTLSSSLSFFARPGNRDIAIYTIAIIVANGVDGQSAKLIQHLMHLQCRVGVEAYTVY